MDGDDEGFLPISYKWLNILFYVFLLVWMAYLLREALTWEAYQDQLIPIAGLTILSILLLVQIIRDLFPEQVTALLPQPSGDEDGRSISAMRASGATLERTKAERDKMMLVMAAWVIAFPVLLYLFGFVITVPIYILAFEYYLTKDLKKSIAATLVFLAIMYVLFIRILNIILWEGVLLVIAPLL